MKKILKLTKLTLQPSPIRLVGNEDGVEITEDGEEPLPHFTLVVYTGGKAYPKDFPCPVVIDLDGLDIPSQKIPVRLEHKSNQGVGHTERIAVVGGEIVAEGVISRDTSWARDVAQSAKNGFPWQISMGGPIHKTEYVPPGHKVSVNGKTFEGELYVVRNMTLKEISFVDIAADANTSATVEAQYDEGDDEMKTETKSQPPESAPTRVEAVGFDSAKAMEEFGTKMLIDQRRIAAIEKIGNGQFPELEAQAIEEGWSVEKFHTQYQHQTMPDASKITKTHASHRIKPTALEAIALASSGSSRSYLESQYDEATLDLVDRYRGIGIQEFCDIACPERHLPNIRRDARGWLEAAFSSVALPGVLSNIANKMLLEGFLQVDETWRKVVKIASASNFMEHQRFRMVGGFKFEKVGADGELKHGKVDEESFSQKIDTYGIMFSLTRQMIIDDNIGAFADIPRGIGLGAGEAINDAVWECLLANRKQKDGKEFFSAAHKNLLAGTSLDIGGLTAAEIAFSLQERIKGRPLGIPPKILLVPTALKVLAETLMKSVTVNETTDINQPKPVINPHAGKYEIVSTPYLSTPAIPGGSASAWYLLADPNRLPVIEVAFLGGVDRPTVERADADFNTLGMQFRGVIDFGVKEQDWRGALKLEA